MSAARSAGEDCTRETSDAHTRESTPNPRAKYKHAPETAISSGALARGQSKQLSVCTRKHNNCARLIHPRRTEGCCARVVPFRREAFPGEECDVQLRPRSSRGLLVRAGCSQSQASGCGRRAAIGRRMEVVGGGLLSLCPSSSPLVLPRFSDAKMVEATGLWRRRGAFRSYDSCRGFSGFLEIFGLQKYKIYDNSYEILRKVIMEK